MLVKYANSLDLDQARQNDGPDLDTLIVFLKELKNNNLEKKISI